jgi:transposase-like protein/IS1 family transposase
VVAPYAQRKSPRGRNKHVDTRGQIQDFYCQACHRKFSARRHTALYRLKTPQARVAQVLHAVAEGLSAQAAARVFPGSETTVRSWISRAGQHSQSLHQRVMRALQLTPVQLDELRLKLRGAAEAAWLWIACDARTKMIPAFTLGPRTQAMAHQPVHEVARRLASGCLPVFSSDGLTLYFFALTAHFGEWAHALGERRRVWTVKARLLYAHVVKRYRRRRIAEVRHQVVRGKPEGYRQALCAQSFSGRIQTAFIERLILTIRRSIAGLARRSWSAAHSLSERALQVEGWRAFHHFARSMDGAGGSIPPSTATHDRIDG